MTWFLHRHVWTEIRRSFSPPVECTRLTGDGRIVKAAMFGLTTIELRCGDCGDLKVTEAFGDLRALASQEKPA